MIHSTKDAGPKLRFELYKEAMKTLVPVYGPSIWDRGWPYLRARGRAILNNDKASDSECAEAIIIQGL